MREISVDIERKAIILTRSFYKKAMDPRSPQYAELQQYKADNPTFSVVRHTIKRNRNKESYRGLTYEYMREYIRTHVVAEMMDEAIGELEEQLFKAKCHSIRYPAIKKWFLATYPEVKTEYGKASSTAEEEIVFTLEPLAA